MYICDNCGIKFDEPAIITERQYHSEVDATEVLSSAVCPCCGYDHFAYVSEEDEEVSQ